MIKFIGTDMDGTLLNSYSKISKENIDSILRAVNSGIKYAICSGRTLHSVNSFFSKDLKIPGYRVVLNGAVVVDPKGKKIVDAPIDKKTVEEIFKRVEFSNFKVVLDGLNSSYIYDPNHNFSAYYEGFDRHHFRAEDFNKLRSVNENENFQIYKVCFSTSPKRLPELKKKLESLASLDVSISRSGSDYFEVNALDVSKLSALQRISEYESIPITEFMCFGDYGNDLEMIKNVGYGVAMDNAIDLVKDESWTITKNNNDNGVSFMIERVLNGDFDE
ncbi:HAD superfamily hydrolase [Companilactobacillus tucceti DSM 20183]|uniref:HAD superfamily hydrolase n=1 Tax=Companilactobacillus tucceti DSM 20183 TaxID=1423811 RepID=A0A0R1JBL7_9LACO|nr:Cof-type HAD-IIB family hydrolase [Companilactobacillus tucceti]KRK65450.1 HAD superfamily hydrolase [Companilactobacillus tucceti DSM 20183]